LATGAGDPPIGHARQAALAVADVCHNLDIETLVGCFNNLYGKSRREVLEEFIEAYREQVEEAKRDSPDGA
jgi:hypothetical protein